MIDFSTIPLILAPMAGAADSPFRQICRKCGADAVFSEMISAKALYLNNKKTFDLAVFDACERPFVMQIFGSDPFIMAHSAQFLCQKYSPDGLDINMGCPVRKIYSNGEGSALMARPELIYEIVARVKEAVPDGISLCVKLRSGLNAESISAVQNALCAQRAGADFVTVHGRTREQMYTGKADYGIIKEVKQALKIPVVGNGDVTDAKSFDNLLATGCDGVMIGRGALGDPFIFERLKCHMRGEEYIAPTPGRIKSVIKNHIETALKLAPEKNALCELRHHISWYLKGFCGAAALRDAANRAETKKQLYQIIETAFEG